jgi:hypothetical protein
MLAKLRPVTFRYKQAQDNGAHPLQYGLIAEEVAEIFSDLAVFKNGHPETVKYHLLPRSCSPAIRRSKRRSRRRLKRSMHRVKKSAPLEDGCSD